MGDPDRSIHQFEHLRDQKRLFQRDRVDPLLNGIFDHSVHRFPAASACLDRRSSRLHRNDRTPHIRDLAAGIQPELFNAVFARIAGTLRPDELLVDKLLEDVSDHVPRLLGVLRVPAGHGFSLGDKPPERQIQQIKFAHDRMLRQTRGFDPFCKPGTKRPVGDPFGDLGFVPELGDLILD